MKRRLVFFVASLTLLAMVNAPLASATITTGATALQIANGIAEDPSQVTGASFVSIPPSGTPKALSSTSLTGFPTDGADYGLLTTGNANLADDANTAGNSGTDDGGGNVRGDTDFDVTVMKVDLNVPVDANCVTVEFRFLSEEFPEFVGTEFNDAFIAELDTTSWTTSGSDITAPDNFAFDPAGNVISINAAGVTSFDADESEGTTYDGATPILAASTPITSGAHSLYLSIFDQGDHIYDSAVFIDNLTLSEAAPGACIPGAFPHQPDALIKQGSGGYKGNNVYNDNGKNQTITKSVHHGNSKTFNVKIQNDGLSADSFTVHGCAASTGFTVVYKKGTTTITAEVVAGTYLIGPLDPGLTKTIKVTIGVKASGDGKTKKCKVTATSVADTTRSDTVVAKVKGT
jgi:hypothetical protein